MSKKQDTKHQNSAEPHNDDPNGTLSTDQVHLHAFLGIRPGVWLTVLYSFIILLALFLVLIVPGLVNPGSLVILKTEPSGAALRVDGVYRGTSPDKVFVRQGDHAMELVLPGFTTVRLQRTIPGRVFASLFFPRRLVLEAGLTSDNPDGVLLAGAKDYAAWTFGGEPTATWQIPFSLSEGAYRAGVSGTDQFTQDMLAASSRFAVTRAAVRDLLRAKLLSDAKGLSPSPLGLLYSGADILRFLSQTPGAPQWLGDVLSAEQIAGLKDSTWYTKASEKLARADSVISEKNTEHGKPPISRLNLGGMIYDGVNSGMLVRGFPYQAQYLPAFMLCTTEVTKEAFNTFIRENPQWNSDNAENLTAQSLASDDYLIDDKPDTLQSAGICGVSWHAARAYCQWLSARLPPSMAAYEVRLPFEAEWEYALGLNSSGHTTENAAAPSGTLWEWCADPWTPVDYIPAPDNAIAALGSPERSLRGILNPADPESYKTRASLPPEFCSSFVSFRPVIALKSDVWQKE